MVVGIQLEGGSRWYLPFFQGFGKIKIYSAFLIVWSGVNNQLRRAGNVAADWLPLASHSLLCCARGSFSFPMGPLSQRDIILVIASTCNSTSYQEE